MPTFPAHDSDLRKNRFPELSDETLYNAFIELCRRRALDPFADQAYPKVIFDNTLKTRTVKLVVQIAGFRVIAHRTGLYTGCDANEFDRDDAGRIIRARTVVYRQVGERRCAFEGEALLAEYAGIPSDVDTAFRSEMPETWLGKCSEACALRRAFPEALSGMYTPEEMARANSLQPRGGVNPTVDQDGSRTEPTEEQPAIDDDGCQLPENERRNRNAVAV